MLTRLILLRHVLVVLLWLVISNQAHAAHILGRVIQIGFPGSSADPGSRGASHVVHGRWMPVRVELTNLDGDLFNGRIQISQKDRDGDRVIAVRDVTVRKTREYYLYVPSSQEGDDDSLRVQVLNEEGAPAPLFNEQGETIETLVFPDIVRSIRRDNHVILDISEDPLTQMHRLLLQPDYARPVTLLRSSEAELPDEVTGLDMVDTIVWDGADPSSSSMDVAQRNALIQWVNQGGTLIVTTGRNWELLARSRLGEMLPAELTGIDQANNSSVLPGDLNDYIFGDRQASVPLQPALVYAPMTLDTLRPDAESVIPTKPQEDELVFAARKRSGRGWVVLLAAEFDSIFRHATQQEFLLQQLMQLKSTRENSSDSTAFSVNDLFPVLEAQIGFQVTAGWFFLFAFMFVIVYLLVATIGSWTWLRRKGASRHAWVTFATCAILASATSLLAVQVVRGIGNDVEELSIVDGIAGSEDVTAQSYFGVKSASHVQLDLIVPEHWEESENPIALPGSLLPLPPAPDMWQRQSFAASKEYNAHSLTGELRNVPFRATVKQFEADWQGRINGTVTGTLTRDPDHPTEPDPSSVIVNQLGTDLYNCHLFVAHRGFLERRPFRRNEIFVYPLGTVENGHSILMSDVYEQLIQDLLPRSQANKQGPLTQETIDRYAVRARNMRVLGRTQDAWMRQLGVTNEYSYGEQAEEERSRVRPEQLASLLMLLSTFEEIPPSEMMGRSMPPFRSSGQELDCSDLLTDSRALFVGFSRDAGPARVCCRVAGSNRKWDAILPKRATVMYRFVIPISPLR